MSLANRYYTPSIEEFHVGFEYEYTYVGISDWVKGPQVSLDVPYNDIYTRRVKYLDKEDIESLGFTHLIAGQKSKTGIIYNEECIVYEKGILSTVDDYSTIIQLPNREYYHISSNINNDGDRYSENLFIGKIKNKSELKIILKQLGIYE